MGANWYALQTRALKEGFVAQQLVAQGLPCYYPQLRVQPVNPRARTELPFFPCYLFVRADLALLGSSRFQYLPHAVGLVCCDDLPTAVDDELLTEIEQRLAQLNAAAHTRPAELRPGERVQITAGPLAGYEAIFDRRLRDGDRVRLLLDLIGSRQTAVELKLHQLRRLAS